MRKLSKIITALLLIAILGACTPGANNTTPQSTNPQTTDPQTTPPVTEEDIYKNGYATNLIVGVDQFGRTLNAIHSTRENKQVGMFFWLWMGQPLASGVYDATKILEMENGINILFHETSSISPNGQAHWWGEPLWGYYNSADEWVIRKQMELITQADVDFIFFDTTNAVTYRNVYRKIMKVISEMLAEGWDAPKVVFYTHSKSMDTVRELYRDIYSRNYLPETWYMLDGKPMIIAYTKPVDDIREAVSRGDHSYKPAEFTEEILNFFTFKYPQWPSDPVYENGFPWIEWHYPQPMHKEGRVMNVTVASHPMVPMSFSLTRKDKGWLNWGRGYNVQTKQNVSEDVLKGTYFQSTWDVALEADPDMISVGGWNEWIAYKQPWDGEYMLCDAANIEYSRDIEMMKGGYNDAYYIQLALNIRKYKDTGVNFTVQSKPKTIDINGDASQWNDVKAIFRAADKANIERDYNGAATGLRYTQPAARNNLQEIRVAQDKDNIYFYIRAENDITAYDNKENWMNIFVGKQTPSLKGWEGYEYLINRAPANDGTTTVESLDASFNTTGTGSAQYSVKGNTMMVKVPRSALGLGENENTFYFKVADGVENYKDIMDYYVTGRSLPMGHLSYQYLG